MRLVDPDVALPYWDSTLDEALPVPADSVLWTEKFFGNGHDRVTAGPYANWPATHELSFVPGMMQLFRDVGSSPFGGLFKPADVDYATSRTTYQDLTACVDPTFEMAHGIVHMFVGGYMADVAISPNDPAFFMHHAFIDHQWELFRQAHQSRAERETQFVPADQLCSEFHDRMCIHWSFYSLAANAQMKPFPIRNIDGLANAYTDSLYTYTPRPSCSALLPDCGSKYLMCDTRTYRCVSKVRARGVCTGFERMDVCESGPCDASGKCPEPLDDTQLTTPTTSTASSATAGEWNTFGTNCV